MVRLVTASAMVGNKTSVFPSENLLKGLRVAFWRLMPYAVFVLVGLVIVSRVLPTVLARLIRRDAKPEPLQTKNQKR